MNRSILVPLMGATLLAGAAWGMTGAEIQAAIDKAAAAGGGRVVVPAGTHDVASLRLYSHIDLHLERGAVLRGSAKSDDYTDFPDEICSIHPERSKKVLIYGYDAEDISITGEGMIDGQGPEFFDRTNRFWPKPPIQRPRMVQFVRVKNLRLEGVTFKDSPCWTMLIRLCEDVKVKGITVVGEQRMPNNDGIDFDGCRKVRVSGSRFVTGDDCLIIRSMPEAGSTKPVISEDIIFEDCDLNSCCQTIRLGCPSDDTIRNVTIRNIRGKGNNGIFADFPVRYLRSGDDGYMDIHNLVVDGYTGSFGGRALQIVSEPGVKVRNVNRLVFRNLDVYSGFPLRFIGNEGAEIKSVVLENANVKVRMKGPGYEAAGCKGLVFKNVTFNGEKHADGLVKAAPGSNAPIKGRTNISWESDTTGAKK